MNNDFVRRIEPIARHLGRMVAKVLLATLAVVVLTLPAISNANVIQYDIVVTVTAAPNAPGSFPSNQWVFPNPPGLPTTYLGTFDADDASVGGQISNLMLTIGGLDIASTHPVVTDNSFDPVQLLLDYIAYDKSGQESSVIFGAPPAPSNYTAAIQNNAVPPGDPYYAFSQNWVGTVAITPSTFPVPEPTTFALLGVAFAGLGFARRRKLR